jgi:predicted phosphodiesterase
MQSDLGRSGRGTALQAAVAAWRIVRAVGRRPARLVVRVSRWWWRDWRARSRTVVLSLVGAFLGIALAGQVGAKVGPFDATVGIRPSLSSDTTVRLAPLGTIVLDTHDWPLAFNLQADQIGLDDAERIADHPESIDTLGDDVAEDVRGAVNRLAMRCLLAAALGGLLGALAARLNWKAAMAGAGTGALVVVTLGGGTALTFDARAVSEPRYTGLLTAAPAAVGDVEAIVERVDEYRSQLRELVSNVVTLYVAAEGLPTFEPDSGTIRVLHVSDIHLNVGAFDLIERVTREFGVDAVVDTGDLVDWGTDAESQLTSAIGDLDVPYVYVRGNHDSRQTQQAVADQPNAVVLDDDVAEVAGLRLWGIGDPRYTPNKDEPAGGEGRSEQDVADEFAPEVAERFAEAEPPAVDVALVHDPRTAADLGGCVPLVLAGHTHEHDESHIDPHPPEEGADSTGDGDGDGDGDGGGGGGGGDEAGDSTGEDDDTSTSDTADDGEGGGGGDDGDQADEGSACLAEAEQGSGDQGDEGTDASDSGGDDSSGDEAELEDTVLLTEGSTGGAGLRGLQGQDPEPLSASILYFDDETHELLAYDHITVAGFGETGATIERHILADDDGGGGDRSNRSAPPAGSG